MTYDDEGWIQQDHTLPFEWGYWDAYVEDPDDDQRDILRIVRDNQMVITVERGLFDSSDDPSEDYQDGYTAGWFSYPIPGDVITCGKRLDWFKAQRHHDWACLGFDTKNKGTEGIVQVVVFACTVCGRDWRGLHGESADCHLDVHMQ